MNNKDGDTLDTIHIPTENKEEFSASDLAQLFQAIEKLNNNIDVLNKMMVRANTATRQYRNEPKIPKVPPKIIH